MTPTKFKPMLAFTVKDIEKLDYPVYISPKIDGIRCLIYGDEPVSRSLKPIPNTFIRDTLAYFPPFDGELVVGGPTALEVFNNSTRGIMSREGLPDFTFWVFDWIEQSYLHQPFKDRLHRLENEYFYPAVNGRIKTVPHTLVYSAEELLEREIHYITLGYEGVMIRDPLGPYKFGRSTSRQGYLGKVKRFIDDEATIIGARELMCNENEARLNELGYQERSAAKIGKSPSNTLGALTVKSPKWEKPFSVGSGFTSEERKEIWKNLGAFMGEKVKFKYQSSGTVDAPRFPIYLGIRKD